MTSIDTSAWRNQAHIIVPESKQIDKEECKDLSRSLLFSEIEHDEEESESEELTDDEVYLERHYRSLLNILKQQEETLHKVKRTGFKTSHPSLKEVKKSQRLARLIPGE